jgi:proline iminopeptidase
MSIRLGTAQLHVEECGSGPVLLVMHGGLGLDHTYLRPYLDSLGSAARVVYYDHRGNGKSPPVGDWTNISHDTWIDDADHLREALECEKTFLLGHSYGGFLAIEYALKYPSRLRGLILCSTAPAFDYADTAMALARSKYTDKQFQVLTQGLSGPIADDDALREVWSEILPMYFKNVDARLVRQIIERIRFRANAFNHSFFNCLPSFNTIDRLEHISTPTLVIGGREDWIMPPLHGPERLGKMIPGANVVIFEDSGHFPFIEEHERFTTLVSNWIDELRRE